MPSLDQPFALVLLLGPALAYAWRRFKRRPTRPTFPTHGSLEPPLPSARRAALSRSAPLLGWAAYFLIVIALAGPVRTTRERVYLERGREIVFALDVSPSMAASDGKRSRIEEATAILDDLAAAGGNASLGLVLFGSESRLASPPTLDRAFFREALLKAKPGSLGEGTDLGLGMASALYHLSASRAPSRLAVVITDGEDNEGEMTPERAAALYARSGTPLLLVGIGKNGEVPLRYEEPGTGRVLVGSLVSGFDRERMSAIAKAAGGTAAFADDAGTLAVLRSELLRAAAPEGASRDTLRVVSYRLALVLAALFLIVAARGSSFLAGRLA